MSVLGNEGGGPHHMQGCHTHGLEISFKDTSTIIMILSVINSNHLGSTLIVN